MFEMNGFACPVTRTDHLKLLQDLSTYGNCYLEVRQGRSRRIDPANVDTGRKANRRAQA